MSPGPNQHPTSELVACAWISAMLDISTSSVATQPPDAATWPSATYGKIAINQFITVRTIGGTPQANVPVQRPVLEVRCYATKLNSDKPPWFAANQICEQIRFACYNRQLGTFGQPLNVTVGGIEYNGANVMQAVMHTEPRRIYGDIHNYAIYQFDMSLTWREIGLVIQ